MKRFAVIGVGGYIAPRHLQAINDTGNSLIAATDINDSVGILDRYTQDVDFFTNFNQFENYIKSKINSKEAIDYVSICSPNHLHSEHMKFALEHNCDVICEKPLVLNESDIDLLKNYEQKYSKKVNTVLQLRVHDSIVALKNKIDNTDKSDYEVDLTS